MTEQVDEHFDRLEFLAVEFASSVKAWWSSTSELFAEERRAGEITEADWQSFIGMRDQLLATMTVRTLGEAGFDLRAELQKLLDSLVSTRGESETLCRRFGGETRSVTVASGSSWGRCSTRTVNRSVTVSDVTVSETWSWGGAQ